MNDLVNSQTSVVSSDEISIDLRQIFAKLTDKWGWFIFGIFICLITAFLYLRYATPIYKINAKLLINNQNKARSFGGKGSGLMDLGSLMEANNSVENEVEILKTRFLMEQVVRDMQLNIVYSSKETVASHEIYEAPFQLLLLKGKDTLSTTSLEIQILKGDKIKVVANDNEKILSWGETFDIKGLGMVQLNKISNLNITEKNFLVTVYNIDSRVAGLMGSLSVTPVNKQVSIIDLGFTYPIPKKGEDILNTLISKYIAANLNDKNAVADSTGEFIKERLQVISQELGSVENKVVGFKEENKLSDMSEQGKLLVQSTAQLNSELAKAETQVSVLIELESYLKDEANHKRIFPSSLILQDVVFSGMMNQYNALLLEREKMTMSVTEESPFIQNIDSQISGLRRGILGNIQSAKNTSILTRDRLRNQLRLSEDKITGVPEIEKNYLKLARNQEIKQELYIFLMQKAEETAISKASNIAIGKTIDPPKANLSPISPRGTAIYLVAILIGLILPAGIIISLDVLNTTVKTKMHVDAATRVPVVGEISHNLSDDNLIVANQSRSAISEQFRALRTNLSFYLKSKDEKVILLTSSMSGEGKSFTAINLGNILALAGNKVLLMEMDLRKPGLAIKLGIESNLGFSNYAIGKDIKIEDIIKPLAINENMFFIASGPLPPNPAETIMSKHTKFLMDELKERFDYIILDAPPIGVIADAQLLASYADATLYLVRQGITQKSQLKIVEDLYQNNKMKNIGIVINDISGKFYGYGYGYGYGDYGQEKKKTIFQKIFRTS